MKLRVRLYADDLLPPSGQPVNYNITHHHVTLEGDEKQPRTCVSAV